MIQYEIDFRYACAIVAQNGSNLSAHIPETDRYNNGSIRLQAKSARHALSTFLGGLDRIGNKPLWAYQLLEPYLSDIVRPIEAEKVVRTIKPAEQMKLL